MRSGSRWFESGVGTQIRIASQRFSAAGSVVGSNRSPIAVSCSDGTSSMSLSPRAEHRHPARVGVVADHGEALLGEGDGQRQPDVAEPDDPDRVDLARHSRSV